jgi:hypothetical protein
LAVDANAVLPQAVPLQGLKLPGKKRLGITAFEALNHGCNRNDVRY